jgi:ubiquinone/menaquinone biosynthesis C-methylase UbiE
MSESDDFLRTRYDQEARQWDKYITEDGIASHAESWLRTDTVDYWRHSRMYACLDPVLESYPESTWLTVGDGRYGRDANYIQSFGHEVVASDISESLLEVGQERGFIEEYSVENAESLSFDDNTFDFAFAKECLHHLPRPWIGLYEMLRVARMGVALIEPKEAPLLKTPRLVLKSVIVHYLRRFLPWLDNLFDSEDLIRPYGNYWEELGNYVFKLSEREIEKVALALNYRSCAFKSLNDMYIEGVERATLDSPIFEDVKRAIAKKDRRCKMGLNRASHSLMACVIFKTSPSENGIAALRAAEYRVEMLPDNPHLSE